MNTLDKAAGGVLAGLALCADIAGNILNNTPMDSVQGMVTDKLVEGIPGVSGFSQYMGMLLDPSSFDPSTARQY